MSKPILIAALAALPLAAGGAHAGSNPAVPVQTSPVTTIVVPTGGGGGTGGPGVVVTLGPNGQLVFTLRD